MAKKSKSSTKPKRAAKAKIAQQENNTFRVSGRVIDRQTSEGIAGLRVEAFDKDLRNDEPLGSATTNDQGRYEIPYSAEQFSQAEKKSADLIIRVFDAEDRLLGESAVIINAPAETIMEDLPVDLRRESELSEYETYLAEITPLLQDIPIHELQEEHFTFLAGETAIERERIVFLSRAAGLSRETDIQAEVFYGFARRGLPLELPALRRQSLEEMRAALEAAIEENIIPARLRDSLDQIMEQLRRLKTEQIPIVELAESLNFELQPVLLNFLSEKGIRRLVDIRNEGGIGHLEGLPLSGNDPVVRRLEAHANLTILLPDLELHDKLIQNGFTSSYTIAETPSPVFVNALSETIGVNKAAQIHEIAKAQSFILNNELTAILANQANGQLINGEAQSVINRMRSLSPEKCACEDCQAAVSPLAYLADLLDYAVKHLQHDKQPITYQYLADNFHQLFQDIPASCEQMKQEIRQVRLCVEVLRSYLESKSSTPSQQANLEKAEKDYRFQAYQTLLTHVGTSYEDIRLARAKKPEERKALAEDRLSIDLDSARPDQLDKLFYDPAAAGGQPTAITEQDLERLFGLVDTTRDPLSMGIKIGDPAGQIVRWNLNGIEWSVDASGGNTDLDGRVFVKLNKISSTNYRVDLFKDRNRTVHIGFGERSTATGTVDISQANQSGISGQLEIDYTANSDNIELVVLPEFLTWRLRRLRTIWLSQDWPSDPYSEGLLPIIDPDLIGPDDFRNPFAKANPAKPFDIWIDRRAWVDDALRAFSLLTNQGSTGQQVPDFTALFNRMNQPLSYGGATVAQRIWKQETQPQDFDVLLSALTEANSQLGKEAKRRIEQDLCLTIESFRRLMAIWAKDKLARQRPGKDPVQEDEWREVFSILTQAQKRKLFPAWIEEEKNLRVIFGGSEFWISLREPVEGSWSSLDFSQYPLIDLEQQKLTDLAEPVAGKRAIELWNTRRESLARIKRSLKNTNETQGFEAMLTEAIGPPDSGQSWRQELLSLKNLLDSANTADVEGATSTITSQLKMSVEDFNRLMVVMAKKELPNLDQQPTEAEWNEVYDLLTSARKRKKEFPNWALEEQNPANGVVYWTALKAKLPQWRAPTEDRQIWVNALRLRNQAPLVDPNLIRIGHIKAGVEGAPAFMLWRDRRNWVESRLKSLKTDRESEPNAKNGLDRIIQQSLGISLKDLQALNDERAEGNDIAARLDQLSLDQEAFEYLLQIDDLLSSGAPVLNTEWENAYSILVQVEKRRIFPAWREKEKESKLTLGPDFFKMPVVDTTVFPPPPAVPVPEWLATQEALLDWEDTLQARIDQQKATVEALREAVSATEESVLPDLRDSLIMATMASNASLAEKAKWITDHFLIDASMDGCQKTNRIAQAIETIQGILWSIRAGLLTDTHAKLELVAPDFDEEWKWIGSYESWRSAVFAFLYPENILMPSLRQHQTPAFRAMVEELRSIRRLTPAKAREIAEHYATYFRDICSLEMKATHQAKTRLPEGERSLQYMFAQGGETGQIYWSVYDYADKSGYMQSYWEALTGLKGVSAIVGIATYQINLNQRYLYCFARTQKEGEQEISFVRYDLNRRKWEDGSNTLSPPEKGLSFSAVVKQQEGEENPPRIIFQLSNGTFYERSLNRDGKDWDDQDWKPMDRLWDELSRVDLGTTKLTPGGHLTAIVNNDPNSLDFFATRSDGLVSMIHWNGYNQQWGPLGPLSPQFVVPVGSPVTGVFRNLSHTTHLDLFVVNQVVNQNRYVYTIRRDLLKGWDAQWTPIKPTQFPPTSPKAFITPISRNPNVIDIFFSGTGKKVYQNSWNGTQWGIWGARIDGTPVGSIITAISPKNSKLHLFAVSEQGEILHQAWDARSTQNDGWMQEEVIPQSPVVPVGSTVAAVARTPGALDVFVVNSQGNVEGVRWNEKTGWGRWQQVGDGSVTFSPATPVTAVMRNADRLLLFAVNRDGVVYSTWQDDKLNDGKWRDWFPVGNPAKDKFPVRSMITAVPTYYPGHKFL